MKVTTRNNRFSKQPSIGRRCYIRTSEVERKSQFPSSKDRLILLLGANASDDFKLKPVLIWHMKSPRSLKNLLCFCSVNGRTEPGWQHIGLQHGLVNILSPLLRLTAQKKKKKFLSKYYCSLTAHLVIQELWLRCTMRLMLFSMPTNTTSAAHRSRSGFAVHILLFKKYIL